MGAKTGHSLNPEQHYRHFWEIPPKSSAAVFSLYNGGNFSMFYMPYRQFAYYWNAGSRLSSNTNVTLRNTQIQLKLGVGYGERGRL